MCVAGGVSMTVKWHTRGRPDVQSVMTVVGKIIKESGGRGDQYDFREGEQRLLESTEAFRSFIPDAF